MSLKTPCEAGATCTAYRDARKDVSQSDDEVEAEGTELKEQVLSDPETLLSSLVDGTVVLTMDAFLAQMSQPGDPPQPRGIQYIEARPPLDIQCRTSSEHRPQHTSPRPASVGERDVSAKITQYGDTVLRDNSRAHFGDSYQNNSYKIYAMRPKRETSRFETLATSLIGGAAGGVAFAATNNYYHQSTDARAGQDSVKHTDSSQSGGEGVDDANQAVWDPTPTVPLRYHADRRPVIDVASLTGASCMTPQSPGRLGLARPPVGARPGTIVMDGSYRRSRSRNREHRWK